MLNRLGKTFPANNGRTGFFFRISRERRLIFPDYQANRPGFNA